MINAVRLTLMLIIVSGLVAFIVYSLNKGTSGFKMMLLGINITLIGGIIAVDPNSNLAGIEYLIVLVGLLVSLVGLKRKD